MRGLGVALIHALVIVAGRAAMAQAPRYEVSHLNGATFVEEVRSDVITQSGTAERRRVVARTATFGMAARGDTLVVTADTVHLTESVDGVRETINVDAIMGARWRLLLDGSGKADLIDRPLVPRSIADVSDAGTAMDDFFPAPPPRMGIGGSATDGAGRKWRRLSDSSGVERYHYSGVRRAKTNTTGDGVAVESDEDTSEITDLAWDGVRGPLAWNRNIVATVTSHFAGRTVRAQVDQRIMVGRVR